MSAAPQPPKWRDTCDPFALRYREFRPAEVLGYPHAGNDVFRMCGFYRGREVTVYVKTVRDGGAGVENEIALLRQLKGPVFPRVLDSGDGFIVTEELTGQRLSAIVGDNGGMKSLEYMAEYGEALAQLHRLHPDIGAQPDRKFMHTPTPELLERLELSELTGYFARRPEASDIVFCHGDFHYANVLWSERHISAILDFELAGYGNREFDIAWALLLRPGQKFLRTGEEQRRFLDGYRRYDSFDIDAVHYFMAQSYVHFLRIAADDPEYCEYARQWLAESCT